MMITKILLKNVAAENISAHEILNKVNTIMAVDNDTAMFATVFCAILDTETGELEFSNAGHNPPLFCRSGRDFEFLDVGKGLVLGPIPDSRFTSHTIKLDPGSVLFLYTDGVTEAMNPQKEFFFEKRLKESLSQLKGRDITEIIRALRTELSAFAQDEPQSDDTPC